jgi:predicted DNA-binding antitoxin AbrB/MazE fold protein
MAMGHIEAIYRRGVFEPLEQVHYSEEQRVWLNIEVGAQESPQSWLNQVLAVQAAITARHGHLPDSAADIAVDRLR